MCAVSLALIPLRLFKPSGRPQEVTARGARQKKKIIKSELQKDVEDEQRFAAEGT